MNKEQTSYFQTIESLMLSIHISENERYVDLKLKIFQMQSNFIKHYFLACAMANHGVSNIVSTNNALLPEDLGKNWNLII